MTGFGLTWLDVAVIAIVALSVVLAAARGFVRETLSIFAWVAAALAALYFGRSAVPFMERHFSPLLAQIGAYSAVFLLVLIPLYVFSYRFSQSIRETPLGTLDRWLGAAFGIARGLAVTAAFYIAMSLAIPVRAQPAWVNHARLLPLVQTSADILLSLIPPDKAAAIGAAGAAPLPGANRQPPETKAARGGNLGHKGYGANERRALDSLIEATGGAGEKEP